MIKLELLSKSYPYLSYAKHHGLNYADVLITSDLYSPSPIPIYDISATRAAMRRLGEHVHNVAQIAAAIASGEIGHGE